MKPIRWTIWLCFFSFHAGFSQTWNLKDDVSLKKDTFQMPGEVKIQLLHFDATKVIKIGGSVLTVADQRVTIKMDAASQSTFSVTAGSSGSSDNPLQLIYTGNNKVYELYFEDKTADPTKPADEKTDQTESKTNAYLDPKLPQAYFDAKALKDHEKNPEVVNLILKKYGITGNHTNKFLPAYTKIIRDDPQSGQLFGSGQSSGSSSPGGLDVTKYADGLAKFMVKRAKEELTIAFFDHFKKELDRQVDVKVLFPRTTATLYLVGEEIYQYERYLSTLRENFESDFEALPDHLTKIIDNHPDYFKKHEDLASGIRTSAKIAIGLRDKDHPGNIMATLDDTDLKGFGPRALQSFKMLKTFSEALRDQGTSENTSYWINRKQFQTMSSDGTWLQYFIGLSLEMIRKEDENLYQELLKAENFTHFLPALQAISAQTSRLNLLIATHSEDKKPGLETVTSYVDAVTSLLSTATTCMKLIAPNSTDIRFFEAKFIPFFKNSNSLIAHITKKKYSSALFNVIALYQLVAPQGEGEIAAFKNLGTPILESLKRADSRTWKNLDVIGLYADLMRLDDTQRAQKYPTLYPAQKEAIDAFLSAYPPDRSALTWLSHYGGFMAALLSAENADEVATVIETYALPSGSAMIKRRSHFNLALNSYLGLYGGVEINGDGVYGVSAPIGIAFSWGNWRKIGSISIFPSLIDIGAVATFRFKNESEDVAKIMLKEIFSPGLFFSYGWKKLPVSMNFGGQFAPLLYRVGTNANEYDIKRKLRLSASIVVDIPLLNLYNRAKK